MDSSGRSAHSWDWTFIWITSYDYENCTLKQ
jgi:hypothetical protein